MEVLHINASDNSGGAARAAYRIHRSLVDNSFRTGVNSRMRVISKTTDDYTVIGGSAKNFPKIWTSFIPQFHKLIKFGFKSNNPIIHSMAILPSGLGRELFQENLKLKDQIINLHWLGDITLSIEELGSLKQKCVWTLHDQWAFCGAEHYVRPPLNDSASSDDIRFCSGYFKHNRDKSEKGLDINRATWKRKLKSWNKKIHIICPSNWMSDCVSQSYLMRNFPRTVIPYPIDLKTWSPINQTQARKILGLPIDIPLILFGADGGTKDPRKGADILFEALRYLKTNLDSERLKNLNLVIFGQSKPKKEIDLKFPKIYLGRLYDDISLRILYSAADVFVIPSRQDNLPNTGLEAQSCGTPVVAFRTGGLPDIVNHQVTGSLADPFNPVSLAGSIKWVLENTYKRNLRRSSRLHAEKNWNPSRIAQMYSNLYKEILDD